MAITDSKERTRRKRREVLIGLTVMVAVMIIGVWLVLANAGKWGVPGFSYTNDHGSTCENGMLSDTCTDLTIEEISARLEVQLPPGTQVLTGTLVTGHNSTLQATMTIPKDTVYDVQAALAGRYGHCRGDLPAPSVGEGMADPCVMGNDQFASESMSIRYIMALGYREDHTDPVLGVDFLWR